WYVCEYVFFFQAEDGIRDFHVTGVQTCALPISLEIEVDDLHPQLFTGGDDLLGSIDVVRRHLRDVHQALDAVAHLDERTELHERSEERRVGKEWRARRWMDGWSDRDSERCAGAR